MAAARLIEEYYKATLGNHRRTANVLKNANGRNKLYKQIKINVLYPLPAIVKETECYSGGFA